MRAYCEKEDCCQTYFIDDAYFCANCKQAPEEVLRRREMKSYCYECKYHKEKSVRTLGESKRVEHLCKLDKYEDPYFCETCYGECYLRNLNNDCVDFELKKPWYSFLMFWRR